MCKGNLNGTLKINRDHSDRVCFHESLAINRDQSLVHSTNRSPDDMVFMCFSPVKMCYAEIRCELVRGRTDSRYEPFDISPEMI